MACTSAAPVRPGGDVVHKSEAHEYRVDVLEVDSGASPGVPVSSADFRHALQRLVRDVRVKGTPQQVAREWMEVYEAEGEWLAEVSRGQVLTLAPATGPLTVEAQEALRKDYLHWCEKRGGGDCLGLLDDGRVLRAAD